MAVKNMLKRPSRASSKRSPGVKKYKKNFGKKSDKIVNKPKQKPTTLVGQDVQFARSLASNDKKKREKTLKKLRVWISVRSKTDFAFTEIDMMRLWKGLFYCMWMSDKPLIQEDLAESISQLVHSFDSMEMSILYTKCALNTLSTEWFGIDQYRLDKFHMLVRRILRQTFFMCKKQSWNLEWVKSVAKVIEEILLNEKCALGFSFHITDIFCEELAKVSEGLIEESAVAEFLRPFVINLAFKSDNRQIRHTVKQVFRYLIFQSDVGMDYKEKFEAWSKAGFPTGNINAMEKVEVSDEENEKMEMADEEMPEVKEKQKTLDPRAGRVDIIIPQLPFDPKEIVNLLEEYKLSPSSTPKTRKHMSNLISEFNEIGKGNMPLGIKEVNIPKRKKSVLNPTKAAKRLLEFEDDLYERKKYKKAKTTKVVKEKKLLLKKNKVKTPETLETESPAKKEELKSPVKAAKSAKTPIPAKKIAETSSPAPKLAETPTLTKKQKLKTPEKVSIVAETTTPSPKKKKLKTPEKATINKKVKTLLKSPMLSEATPPTKKEKLVTPVNTPTVLETTPGVKKNKLKSPKVRTTSLAKKEKLKTPEKTLTASGIQTPAKKETFKTPVKTPLVMEASSSAKKKVTIVLANNTAQQTSEYLRQLRMSPQLPFDGSKKPPPGVLKKSFVLSPMNPWYKRSLLY